MREQPPHPGRHQLRREKRDQDEQHVLPRQWPEEAPRLSVFVHRDHVASWVRYFFETLASFNTFFENQNTSHATMRKSSPAPKTGPQIRCTAPTSKVAVRHAPLGRKNVTAGMSTPSTSAVTRALARMGTDGTGEVYRSSG